MWFGGGIRASLQLWRNNSARTTTAGSLFVRHMSRKRAVNVRKINPKVPIQEAYSISNSLYDVIKHHGPLSVPNTWIQAKEAGVNGLNSKTHMKLLLKWMTGKKMLKLLCNHVGSNKKFMYCTLPEDPQTEQIPQPKPQTQKKKPSAKGKKSSAKGKKQKK